MKGNGVILNIFSGKPVVHKLATRLSNANNNDGTPSLYFFADTDKYKYFGMYIEQLGNYGNGNHTIEVYDDKGTKIFEQIKSQYPKKSVSINVENTSWIKIYTRCSALGSGSAPASGSGNSVILKNLALSNDENALLKYTEQANPNGGYLSRLLDTIKKAVRACL